MRLFYSSPRYLGAALVYSTLLLLALRVPKRYIPCNQVDAHCKPVGVFVIDCDVKIFDFEETFLYLLRSPFYHWIIVVQLIRAVRISLEELAHELGGVKERIAIKLLSKKVHIDCINHFVVEPTGRASFLHASLLNQITTVFCTVEIVIWGKTWFFVAAALVVLCDRALLLILFLPPTLFIA